MPPSIQEVARQISEAAATVVKRELYPEHTDRAFRDLWRTRTPEARNVLLRDAISKRRARVR
jgi:5'-deoxynucleotidase YfbR-like HD superfamily hydrolase